MKRYRIVAVKNLNEDDLYKVQEKWMCIWWDLRDFGLNVNYYTDLKTAKKVVDRLMSTEILPGSSRVV